MLILCLLLLVQQSFAACNSSLVQADILQRCQSADASRACPPLCQASVQAANACKPLDQALSVIVQRYSFCKPRAAKCKLILKQDSCTGTCQWCNNKCQANAVKCQAPQCSSLQQAQCQDQCEWCASSRACVALKQCTSPSDCRDDPKETLARFGYDCPLLLEVTSNKCDFDLTGIDESLKGVTPGQLCPKACSQCPPSTSAASASQSSIGAVAAGTPAAACRDDPDGLIKAQGYDCKTVLGITANNCSFDLNTLSPAIPKGITPALLCPQSCRLCEGQTPIAVPSSPKADGTCKDDPEGLAAQQGLNCKSIMEYATNNCTFDLNTIRSNLPKGFTPARICPKTCQTCSSSTCVDDPSGLVAQNGFTCATILGVTGNDCEKDLNTLSAAIPKGVTPNQLCPKSCGRCKDAAGNTAPVPQKTTDTFINGHLMTPTERSWLAGLGVTLPPGRYYIRPDGSAGLEGGPVLMNIYSKATGGTGIENAVQWTQAAGQTAGQSVTQAASTTRAGAQNAIAKVSNFFRPG